MKKTMIVMVMLCMAIGNLGCSQEAITAIAGASGLTAASRILEDIEGTTDREKALLLADRLALEEERATATSEADKVRIDNEIEKNEKLTEAVAVANESARIAGVAVKTDWTDPTKSGPFIGMTLTAIIAYLLKRKKDSLSGLLSDIAAESEPDQGKSIRKRANGH